MGHESALLLRQDVLLPSACRMPARWGGRAHASAPACAVTTPVHMPVPPRPRPRARPRAGQQLFKKSNKPAWVTAVMFCRRYFAVKSLQRNDMIILGAAALHLAGKAEDDPQRLDKVIHQIFTYRRAPPTLGRRVLTQGAAGSGGIRNQSGAGAGLLSALPRRREPVRDCSSRSVLWAQGIGEGSGRLRSNSARRAGREHAKQVRGAAARRAAPRGGGRARAGTRRTPR